MKNPQSLFNQIWTLNRRKVSEINPSDIGCLQLMLLKCKPALNDNKLALMSKDILKKHGYVIKNNWVYDPEQIDKLSEEYEDVFHGDVLSCFEKPIKSLDDIKTGLVLGIPYNAAHSYSQYYSSSNNHTKAISGISVNVFGHCWIDFAEMDIQSVAYVSKCLQSIRSSGLYEETRVFIPPDWLEVYTCSLSIVGL
jgi:hypothetical protein